MGEDSLRYRRVAILNLRGSCWLNVVLLWVPFESLKGANLVSWMDDRAGLHSRAAAEMRDDACRSRGSALVTMVEPANLRNGNDPSSFWWLDRPRLRRILLQS